MTDRIDDLEGKLSEMASRTIMWKSLMAHPGWEEFCRIVREQQAMRSTAVMMTPIAGDFTVYAQEYFKGEFAGMSYSLRLPQEQYEAAQRQQQIHSKELEVEYETERQVAAAESRERERDDNPFGE